MSTENGQIEQVEIIPDFENEMIEEMPQQQQAPEKPCGCNKGKNAQSKEEIQTSINWLRIGTIVGVVLIAYMIFKKKNGSRVEIPKVEVPEV